MKRYEYDIAIWTKTVVPIEGMIRDLRPEVVAWMNTLGAEGWDIFAVAQTQTAANTLQIACNCKREITDKLN